VYVSIQAAIDAVRKGDMVVVSSGTYHENIALMAEVVLP
jgi:hypothetical protein